MGRVMSDRALRDYAYRVLKSEYGERMENGILIPAKNLMKNWRRSQRRCRSGSLNRCME